MEKKEPKLKRTCIYCNKSLVAIGTSRNGGKQTHGDWNKRQLHKKCLKDYYFWLEILDEIKKANELNDKIAI